MKTIKEVTMKTLCLIGILLFSVPTFAKKQDLRSKIGPTVHAPIEHQDKLYFLSTTGGLFQSDKEIKSAKLLAQTDQVTVSPLTLVNEFLFFGDGLTEHTTSGLYRYHLKTKKIDKKLKVQGHIQRKIRHHQGRLFVGQGTFGLNVYDTDLSHKWGVKEIQKQKLTIDSNPIIYKDLVCVASTKTYNAIICLDKASGKLKHNYPLKESPKGELSLSGKYLYGFSTEADMLKTKFDIKSHLYVIDLENNKLIKNIELRGYNFFKAPAISEDKVLVNISTGDILLVDIVKGKIEYIGEFPEPFVSTPFVLNDEYCTIGIMGKLLCYKKGKNQYHITKEKRLFESPVGNINVMNNKAYIPSRMGYFIVR
jgi:outer membrane protein assembly factor BamB